MRITSPKVSLYFTAKHLKMLTPCKTFLKLKQSLYQRELRPSSDENKKGIARRPFGLTGFASCSSYLAARKTNATTKKTHSNSHPSSGHPERSEGSVWLDPSLRSG